MNNPNKFTIFEHGDLREDIVYGENTFTKAHHQLLENFYKEKDFPYYKLIRDGVRFCEYVGVLQIGNLVIEVLPKADKSNDTERWRNLLLGMLRAVGIFKIHAPSSSALHLQSNSILDLYFELYINELEYLLHRGLVKRYRKTEGNTTALKGNLLFGKHIQQNLVHQERFYVRYTTYDTQHLVHSILYKALRLIKQINTKSGLQSKIGAMLLNFPEMPDIKVSAATFEKLSYNRKDEHYQTAVEIARLILLNFHPDVAKGRNHVLALMFDMNLLWEKFVYVSLKKFARNEFNLRPQEVSYFWKPEGGYRSKMKPDIVITQHNGDSLVLDTKWKNLNGYNPSPEDLRQMFVYHEYFGAKKVALVYPNHENKVTKGHYIKPKSPYEITDKECSVILIATKPTIKEWQQSIYSAVFSQNKENA